MRWMILLAAAACLAFTADARFADTQGFSGKHAVDCGACHALMPGDPWDEADVAVDGLPEAWTAERRYALKVTVSGGPPPAPGGGQPQGGFDLESDSGRFTVPASMVGLLRTPSELEITYTGPGTTMRQWTVDWTAPTLTQPPTTVRFWVAGLSANGNHVIGGPEAGGERGDRVATATYAVAPDADTVDAWALRPVPVPTIDPLPDRVYAQAPAVLVTGRVVDWADHAQWRVGQGAWTAAAGRPVFLFHLPALDPGVHRLQVEAVVGQRTSHAVNATVTVLGTDGQAAAAADSEPRPLWPLLLLAAPLVPFIIKLARDRS